MSGPSGMLYGPTGTKIGGGGADNSEPTSGDFKKWADWHATDKLFGANFFSSQVADAMSWDSDFGNTSGAQTPTFVDGTDSADGTPSLRFALPVGIGNQKVLHSTRMGSVGSRFGIWPNSFLMIGYVAKWTFDAAAIAANPGGGYSPYDQIKITRHGFSSFTSDPGFFCGWHGGLCMRYGQVLGASNPFFLSCSSGFVHPNFTPGPHMISTIPLVSGTWYRVLFARDGINTYFKVNGEPWQQSASIYEAYPGTEDYRVPRFISEQLSSGSGNQVATSFNLSSIYTARGVQRVAA